MSGIAENLEIVRENIRRACLRAGRNADEVTLIAVSKTHSYEAVAEAARAGQYVFGENKVQELAKKASQLAEKGVGVSWHMIGHLQSNKVKYLIGTADMIHSLESLGLADKIEKQAAIHGVTADVLCEVNIAAEDSKFGLRPGDVPAFVRDISGHEHLRIRGLMTVAPFTEDPESNRVYFERLRLLLEDVNAAGLTKVPMDVLSMGMSGDYEVAVEEGATHVRVGTAIFGARDYGV